MTIRFNPRLILKRTQFRALSCIHLQSFLLKMIVNKNNENAWLDMRDALYDGSFFRWLERQNFDTKKLEKMRMNIHHYDLIYEMLESIFSIIFETIPPEVNQFLKEKKDEEIKVNSFDELVIGKNLVLTLNQNPKVLLEMVWIAPGTFDMGRDDTESYDDEKPIHKVNITKGYWIGKYQLTQGQWKVVVNENSERNRKNHIKGDYYPAENVSWSESDAFCAKLNDKFRDIIKDYYFNLPTEAQWEFAAREGEKSRDKYQYSGSDILDEVGWFIENSRGESHEVGLKKPNARGIYDMSGNIFEWCRDWYDYYSEFEVDDPVGPNNGKGRVFRGGSWGNSARYCRISDRRYDEPSARGLNLGFRVALVPVQ